MNRIRFYFKPDKPVDCQNIETKVLKKEFLEIFGKKDYEEIERIWEKLKKERGNAIFSRPNRLGSLYDTQNGIFSYKPTDFKTYLAATNSYADKLLSQAVYNNMRISSVGGVVRLADGNIFVHRRSKKVTHVKDYIDSSVAGLAAIDSIGNINFKAAILEKLERELKIVQSEIKSLRVSAVHESHNSDFSGMCDFVIDTELEAKEVNERVDKEYFGEYFIVPSVKLPEFIIDHFLIQQDMSGDGCATLLASLEHKIFLETVNRLRKAGKRIEFGQLENGIFVPLKN